MFLYRVDHELSLKLLTQADAEDVFDLIDENRAHLRQWLGWIDASTEVSATAAFLQYNLERFTRREGLNAGILYKGKLVGQIGFNNINAANRTAEIGYMLAKGYTGKGIITRATEALVNLGFNEFRLQKIEIRVAAGNEKSCAIPIRLGFVQEGLIRSAEWLYDHYVDHVVYGMLRREWLEGFCHKSKRI